MDARALPIWVGDAVRVVIAALALALGLADDVRNLCPRLRLAGAAGVGVAVVAVATTRFAAPREVAHAVAVTVALVNAVNMLDGLDGLAAGVAVASTAGWSPGGGRQSAPRRQWWRANALCRPQRWRWAWRSTRRRR